jgi:hypothetical protein
MNLLTLVSCLAPDQGEQLLRPIFMAVTLTLFGSAWADDEILATPYRPSVSTPAQLSAPGWLEGEFGLQRLTGPDSVRRESLPYSLKYAFTHDWGVRVSGDSYVRYTDNGSATVVGGGDTAIVLKRRFASNHSSAFGLELGVNFPTAKSGLGSDKTNYSVNCIYSTDLDEWHMDLNLIGARVGHIDADQGRWQATWAGALSHPLNEKWGIVGEFSGTQQRGIAATAQFLTAFSYSFSKGTVFDIGAAAGLNHSTPNMTVFSGVTLLLGKVH